MQKLLSSCSPPSPVSGCSMSSVVSTGGLSSTVEGPLMTIPLINTGQPTI